MPASTVTRKDGVRPAAGAAPWLLLTHRLPPEPAYLRVKVRRQLDRFGAVALKNSVYALPNGDDTLEDLQWLAQDIRRAGGDATICEAAFVDDTTDRQLLEGFASDREAAYSQITASALELTGASGSDDGASRGALVRTLEGLTRRMEEVTRVDFFAADGRLAAERALAEARTFLYGEGDPDIPEPRELDEVRESTWTTRENVKVDRIASAWLIRRFIDPLAAFRFVPARGASATPGELRFDMFDGEYTHVGNACTFEVLLQSFGLEDPSLAAVGEIVHDIDCKDGKFGRPETTGIASLVDGVVRRHEGDEERLIRGGELFDDLYEHFASARP